MVTRRIGAEIVERVLDNDARNWIGAPAEELVSEIGHARRHHHRLQQRTAVEGKIRERGQVTRERHVPQRGTSLENGFADRDNAVRHDERGQRRAAVESPRPDVRHRVGNHGHIRLRRAAPQRYAAREHVGHHIRLALGYLRRLDLGIGGWEKIPHRLDVRRHGHAGHGTASRERLVAHVRHRGRQTHRLHLPAVLERVCADMPNTVREGRPQQGRAIPECNGADIAQTGHELDLLNPRAAIERPRCDASQRFRHRHRLQIVHLLERAAPDADDTFWNRHRRSTTVLIVQNPVAIDHKPVFIVDERRTDLGRQVVNPEFAERLRQRQVHHVVAPVEKALRQFENPLLQHHRRHVRIVGGIQLLHRLAAHLGNGNRIAIPLPLRRVGRIPRRNRCRYRRFPAGECTPFPCHRRRGQCRPIIQFHRLATRPAVRIERHRVLVDLPLRRVRLVPGRHRRWNAWRPPRTRIPRTRHRRCR